MDGDDSRLDGNVLGGILGELFPFDVTTAYALCAGCGSMEPVGKQPVYVDAPGMIVRCLHCDSVLIRVAHGGGRYWLDMRGAACLQIAER